MTNTGTRGVESRKSWGRVLGRALLSTLIFGAGLGALSARAEAQTTTLERTTTAPIPRVERVTETVVQTEPVGEGGGHALIGIGGFLLVGGWVSSFAVGLHEGPELFISDEELNRPREWYEDFRFVSFIPIAGPWMALAQRDAYSNAGFTDDAWGVWLVSNGLIQAAGATMIICGAIARAGRNIRYNNRIRATTTTASGGVHDLRFMPNVATDRAVLTVSGTF